MHGNASSLLHSLPFQVEINGAISIAEVLDLQSPEVSNESNALRIGEGRTVKQPSNSSEFGSCWKPGHYFLGRTLCLSGSDLVWSYLSKLLMF
jgi:hypothetical protein